jgi:hypothetical protein
LNAADCSIFGLIAAPCTDEVVAAYLPRALWKHIPNNATRTPLEVGTNGDTSASGKYIALL